ncbi:MAG: hypothetical protein MK116_10865 [Phycisphaerales bacterium]|nr:hypothetical protein [Phycisphaerales bacterium]
MNSATPVDTDTITTAVREAMRRHEGDSWDDVNPEAIVVLAQGRGHELPPQERVHLLKRIASDPDLGTLLRDLQQDLADSIAAPRFVPGRLVMQAAWVACLIGLVTISAIRLGGGPSDRSVEVLDSSSGAPEYLEQLGNPTGAPVTSLIGDPVFVGLFLLAVVLGVGSFWPRRETRP